MALSMGTFPERYVAGLVGPASADTVLCNPQQDPTMRCVYSWIQSQASERLRVLSLMVLNSPVHFTDGKIEAQRSGVISSRTHT